MDKKNYRKHFNSEPAAAEELKHLEQSEDSDKYKITSRADLANIFLLIWLYFFQGIPFGLVSSVPLILSSRKVSYADQGTFSFASWPFAFKIFWAPVIDAFYNKRIGRRKTWVVSTIFLIGVMLLSFADHVNSLLDPTRLRQTKDIYILTVIFGVLVFLSACQDIALDGWSLELLFRLFIFAKKIFLI